MKLNDEYKNIDYCTVLSALNRHGPQTIEELSKRGLLVPKGNFSRILERLIADGEALQFKNKYLSLKYNNETMEGTAIPNYEPPFDPTDIGVDTWKIFFAQAEKRLDGTIKNAELISGRGQTMVTILSGIILASFGFATSQLRDGFGLIGSLGIYSGLFALYILYKFAYSGYTGFYMEAGTEPETMLKKEYTGGNPIEQQQWAYENVIISYHVRIKNNLAINKERWETLNWTRDSLIVLACSLPVLYVLLAVLIWWIKA